MAEVLRTYNRVYADGRYQKLRGERIKSLIAGNPKMNPTTKIGAYDLVSGVLENIKGVEDVDVVFAPPYLYLTNIQILLGNSLHRFPNVYLGAQDVFWMEKGAYTGEISPAQLKDLGLKYVIVGHSERRGNFGRVEEDADKIIKGVGEWFERLPKDEFQLGEIEVRQWRPEGEELIYSPLSFSNFFDKYLKLFLRAELKQHLGETDEMVNLKVKALLRNGLIPIMCVGETKEERETGKTTEVVERQVREGLEEVDIINPERLVIAYEPVWAIGTGNPCDSDKAEEVHAFIRSIVQGLYGSDKAADMRILHGGSVTPENIVGYMKMNNIDGALVGGKSLIAGDFSKIIKFGLPG